MPTPHKHAAVIKAWADGAEIEWRASEKCSWQSLSRPLFLLSNEYRVKPQPPHKWQKEMDAYAAGKTIQFRQHLLGRQDKPVPVALEGCWLPLSDTSPAFFDTWWLEFRIKPEEVVRFIITTENESHFTRWQMHASNLKLIFEDGELTKAEVLK